MSESHSTAESSTTASKQNWLRAAMLGANDGIVSVAALIVGVAGATSDLRPILVAGVAGILAGALSMAVGEYVSVSSQRDTELALLEKERGELRDFPEVEREELTKIYQDKGLSRTTAEMVAIELTNHDAFAAHVEAELKIDPKELANPWHAAIASGSSFTAGAVIPLISITVPSADSRIIATFIAVFFCLALTGYLSARMSAAKVSLVVGRVVTGGILAMIITFGIGRLFGVASV